MLTVRCSKGFNYRPLNQTLWWDGFLSCSALLDLAQHGNGMRGIACFFLA
jgi:hypothetical protein